MDEWRMVMVCTCMCVRLIYDKKVLGLKKLCYVSTLLNGDDDDDTGQEGIELWLQLTGEKKGQGDIDVTHIHTYVIQGTEKCYCCWLLLGLYRQKKTEQS